MQEHSLRNQQNKELHAWFLGHREEVAAVPLAGRQDEAGGHLEAEQDLLGDLEHEDCFCSLHPHNVVRELGRWEKGGGGEEGVFDWKMSNIMLVTD